MRILNAVATALDSLETTDRTNEGSVVPCKVSPVNLTTRVRVSSLLARDTDNESVPDDSNGNRSLTFSVIVPLGFHRDQAERCLKAWAQNQTYPRNLYEIVVVAPDNFSCRELSRLRSLLAEHDRLLVHPERHDMALVVTGVDAADHEVLFFTESHCWPEPDVLERTAAALRAHPDWAGLNCCSVPVTHNPLSVAEADMYRHDIENATFHDGRQTVLDHCFAVHREPYFRSGDFDADLGHFAEWMLAARLSHLGLTIGYVPEARVHHFYVGRLVDLREFTEDFTRGEMHCLRRSTDDTCLRIFLDAPPEWTLRDNWNRTLAGKMLKMRWRDSQLSGKAPDGHSSRSAGWTALTRWLPAAIAGVIPAWSLALLRAWQKRFDLWKAQLFSRRRHGLHGALLHYVASVIRVRRLFYLRLEQGGIARRSEGRMRVSLPDRGTWNPARDDSLRTAGLHLAEALFGEYFRWSEPAALVELPLPPGSFTILFRWLPVRPPDDPIFLRFYFNECPAPTRCIKIKDYCAEILVTLEVVRPLRLGWVCAAFQSPGNTRLLGVPVSSVSWIPAAVPTEAILPVRTLFESDRISPADVV
ncbi:MAG: glycosyltransferase [Bryobacterales bacterium]|nr:glycosyltransferase [Bryobacterales bacterium]